MTQGRLALALGIAGNTISRWETGTYEPSIDDLKYVAAYFKVPVSIFFPDDTEYEEDGIPQVDLTWGSISEQRARQFREALMNACDDAGFHPYDGQPNDANVKLYCPYRLYRRIETVYLHLGIPMDDILHFQKPEDRPSVGNVYEIEMRSTETPRKVIMRVVT